jgi:CysZ protein
MKGIIRAFPVAFKMIVTDPVNFVLAFIPTLIALGIYLLSIVFIYAHSEAFMSLFRNYISPDQVTWMARILTAILIIFMFFIMSWTFVIVVGIIASPFNSVLSSRIEQKLVLRVIMDEDQAHAFSEVKKTLAQTFKNEIKKVLALILMSGLAFILNLVPFFYPVALFLIALLFAVQFLDYSWSRHKLFFSDCLRDALKNILSYSVAGALFLALIAIPLFNAFVPALATSYFTVLWLFQQKKIDL